MEGLILDKIDFNILALLAKDCRASYNSMGSLIGLTSKSVKARVKSMVRNGVIEKFVVRVNPEKTTTRRLDRMKEGRLLEFSIQCDPASMTGYVQFAILINVEKTHYRNVCERMYTEFQENILYRPSIIDPDDRLIFVLFGEN